MSHMVIYRTGDGQPGYHQAEELDEAVKFVERLRNGDGVDSARIFHMEEVNFDFRPYFKVEIGPSGEPLNGSDMSGLPTPSEASREPAPAPASIPDPPPAPAPAPTPSPADAWGDLGADSPADPTPLVDEAPTLLPDPEEPPAERDRNGDQPEEGVGARRGLFGR